jgi:predicted transcriptional regulator
MPVGFMVFKNLCHIGSMDDELRVRVQEIYDNIVSGLRQEITKLREQGKSQEDIADLCGVTQATISRICGEKRGTNLPLKSVLKIAICLDIDLMNIFPPSEQSKAKIKAILSEIDKIVAHH